MSGIKATLATLLALILLPIGLAFSITPIPLGLPIFVVAVFFAACQQPAGCPHDDHRAPTRPPARPLAGLGGACRWQPIWPNPAQDETEALPETEVNFRADDTRYRVQNR